MEVVWGPPLVRSGAEAKKIRNEWCVVLSDARGNDEAAAVPAARPVAALLGHKPPTPSVAGLVVGRQRDMVRARQVRDMGDSLFDACAREDEVERAGALAVHARRWGLPDLCEHGLPPRHLLPQQGQCEMTTAGKRVVRVSDIVALSETLDALQVGFRARRAGQQVPERVWQAMEAYQIGGSVGPKDRLRRPGLRGESGDVLTEWANRLMVVCGLEVGLSWRSQFRPEPAYYCRTTTAMVLADVMADIGKPDEERSYTCRNCGDSFVPKRGLAEGEKPYCRRPECQAQRKRENQRLYRERTKSAKGKG